MACLISFLFYVLSGESETIDALGEGWPQEKDLGKVLLLLERERVLLTSLVLLHLEIAVWFKDNFRRFHGGSCSKIVGRSLYIKDQEKGIPSAAVH